MSLTTLEDLVTQELQQIYYVELKLIETLNDQIRTVADPAARQAFAIHEQQTQGQIRRLEQVFDLLDQAPQTVVCVGIDGILRETEEITEEDAPQAMRDLCNVLLAQKIEHYEISTYEALIDRCRQMGHEQVAGLLAQTLQEEEQSLHTLQDLAYQLAQPLATAIVSATAAAT